MMRPRALTVCFATCLAAACGAHARYEPPTNTLCPVMEGEPVSEEFFSDHEGVRIYFCCSKCRTKFNKDPLAYLDKVPAFARPTASSKQQDASTIQIPDRPSLETRDAAALQSLLFAASDDEARLARLRIRLRFVPRPTLDARAGREIDDAIRSRWREARVPEAESPPPLCTDEVFVRRVYLDVIGVIPTLDERARFFRSPDSLKREKLIDELLARDQDYADHWTPFWEDALGSTNINNTGGIASRGNYREWINKSFRENKPFDLFAAELIDTSLPGAQKPSIAEANGRRSRTSYVLNETHTSTLQSAANVAQVFMGTAMKCASCHGHFENPEWPQQRFLSFAGMFSGRDLELIRCEKSTGAFVAATFPFDIPDAPSDVPTDEAGRLRRVAQLLTDPANPRFARAIVNRLWKRYVGLGFFEPADDFRIDRKPSHPELLDWLAYDLMSHDFDLKRTIRIILNSETYQSRYDPALEDQFDIQRPDDPRYFRSPTLRRLSAEQVIDSILVASRQKLEHHERLFHRNAASALTLALGKPAARAEISTARADDAAVLQALEILNGQEFHQLAAAGELAVRIARERDANAAALLAYLSVLSREPSPSELEESAGFLMAARATKPDQVDAFTDELWLDDELPPGSLSMTPTKWEWTEINPASGIRAHTQRSDGKHVQHYFKGADPAWIVRPTDTLFTHVYIDPRDPPKQIMIQWNDGRGDDGGWSHRAYWGEDIIRFGTPNTKSRRYIGPLPKAGEWTTLEVPATLVGLGHGTATHVSGMSFDQVGGTVTWDLTGVRRGPGVEGFEAAADLLWALFASAEFQYLR